MIRFLNFLALIAVIASATWAYSVKYETILVAEKLKKREAELRRERDAIQVLSAEWELLNRPGRLAALAKPEAGMQQLSARQVVNARDIPAAQPAKTDMLDSLLTGSIPPAPKTDAKTADGKTGATAKTGAPAKLATPKAAPAAARKAPGDKPDAKVVAVKAAPKPAPLSLAPKTGTSKASAAPKSAPKVAPKANAPVKLTPPAPVAASPSKRDEGGLNSLFKKILN